MKKSIVTKFFIKIIYRVSLIGMVALSFWFYLDVNSRETAKAYSSSLLPKEIKSDIRCKESVYFTFEQIKDITEIHCYGTEKKPTNTEYPFYTSITTSSPAIKRYFQDIKRENNE